MILKDIIQEIRKLNIADQYRLKEFFTNLLVFYSANKAMFKMFHVKSAEILPYMVES
jgi:hypothetical protein